MIVTNNNSYMFKLVFGICAIFMFAIILLPTFTVVFDVACNDCDEGCNNHGESVCGCIGCSPITFICELSAFDSSQSLDILSHAFIDSQASSKREFFDRLDRPPQVLI